MGNKLANGGQGTPPGKLISWFRASRDGWKGKCAEAKRDLKASRVQGQRRAQSSSKWKEVAKEAQREAQAAKARIAELEERVAELEAAQKKSSAAMR